MKISLPNDSKLLSPEFTYGVATASFQIEGGVDERLPCIWDTFCRVKGKIKDNSNGDIACDHYNRWQQDIDLIETLGVDAYRLSISWPRVLKMDGSINQKGVDFYKRILDRLNDKQIKPFVTLYHWDLPQHHENRGGWLNRETAFEYADYADKISRALGDRVFSYATLNEPYCSAYLGYEAGIHAPGLASKKYGKRAAHHLLLGHGLAMKALQANSPNTQNGIVLNFTPCYPSTSASADIQAAKMADAHFNQWYIKPLFDAEYPEIIETIPKDERPEIFAGDMEIIAAPLDFMGVNFYTRQVYQADTENQFVSLPPSEPVTDIGWEIFPQAFVDLMSDLNQRYDLPPIYITENGAAMADDYQNGEVIDYDRTRYVQDHLTALDKIINLGIDVKGYFYWSLMDNFEWAEGYAKRFGIVYVDYENQKRVLKHSALAYKDLISNRSTVSSN
ncbi:beta-glucosidase [Aliikangiella marina]|uniref:Beta-glucosidase n=1 Tax=Aliikangiella marina TaxID=1712262 RepID=A0A545T188_9GAMM|nr:GH1 family beta-glucosidase [Aliikangiella marina]TQV70971.1 beta-glucosidase [Aliikangiella marina]